VRLFIYLRNRDSKTLNPNHNPFPVKVFLFLKMRKKRSLQFMRATKKALSPFVLSLPSKRRKFSSSSSSSYYCFRALSASSLKSFHGSKSVGENFTNRMSRDDDVDSNSNSSSNVDDVENVDDDDSNSSSNVDDVEDVDDDDDDYDRIHERLLKWYDEGKRLLPWRRFTVWTENECEEARIKEEEEESVEEARGRWEKLKENPSTNKKVMSDDQYAYGVWVSEIMSQQTQIERVAEYWQRWVKKWPRVEDLAKAEEDEVREMWAGLGYYRRSQFLLNGAKYVTNELCGKFPRDVIGLLKIPGIGPYTAAAVGSIAFGIKAPAIDGNVNRVLTRVKLIKGDPVKEKKALEKIKSVAETIINRGRQQTNNGETKVDDRPGDFNQAIMELGATVCKPKNPACKQCPISDFCQGLKLESATDGGFLVTSLPESSKKADKRMESIGVAVITCTFENSKWFFLTKRPENGLLGGMWEFPSVLMCEGENATKLVPSEEDVQNALQFFAESDSRGVSALVSDHASMKIKNSIEEEEEEESKNGKDQQQKVLTTSFKHESGVVTHVFSHVKHFMHLFSLDFGVVANGRALPVILPAASVERGDTSKSKSSWFKASDFQEKGAFSTGVQKVFASFSKLKAYETSGSLKRSNSAIPNGKREESERHRAIKTKSIKTFFQSE
jgi:A/G-specific adenine glycosylase